MKITEIQAKCFGRLQNIHLSNLNERLVIICGPNEGGKSTLFQVIETLLYGFNPAKSDSHPYTCWSGGQMELEAAFLLDDEKALRVHRKLMSTPRGRLEGDGQDENIRNRSLPQLDHVSRELFAGIYSLTLEDMQIFKGQSWDAIQARLLSNLGAESIRTPRQVIIQLESDANSLWRSDNRGKPRARELENQVRQLRQERLEAQKRYSEIHSLDTMREEMSAELVQKKEALIGVKAMLRKAQRLNPVRKSLDHIEALKHEIGDVDALQKVPNDIGPRLDNLTKRRQEYIENKEALSRELKKHQAKCWSFSDTQTRLLQNRQQIRGMVGLGPLMTSDSERIRALIGALDRLQAQLETGIGEILEEPWQSSFEAPLREISKAALNGAVKASRQARLRYEDLQHVRDREPQGLERKSQAMPVRWVIVLCISILFIVGGVYTDDSIFNLFGSVGAVLSLSALWTRYQIKNAQKRIEERSSLTESLTIQLQQAEEKVKLAADQVHQELKGLPVAAVLLENPDELLVSSIVGLQQILEAKTQREEELKELQKQKGERVSQLSALSETWDPEQGLPPQQEIARLMDQLDKLEQKEREKQAAGEAITTLQDEIEEIDKRIQGLVQEMEELQAMLPSHGSGDLEQRIEAVATKKRHANIMVHMQESLQGEYPDLEQLILEIEELDSDNQWIFSDEDIERAKTDQEKLEDEISALEKQLIEKKNEMDLLGREKTLDAIDGELEQLSEQLERVFKKRDALELLRRIVIRADEQFRQQHQPDVLKKAAGYLQCITENRYQQLFFEEQDGQHILMAQMADNPFPVPVSHPLSRGTLDQIYLSLRLSLMDHLDDGKETLPLCLDEILVNWDDKRLELGLDLMRQQAANRQIFMFTCHQWLACEVADKFGVAVIHIEG